MSPITRQRMRGRIAQTGLFCLFGLWLAACGAARPVSYSLEDSEIFIAPRSHALNLAVAVLEDRRAPEEREWAARFKLPSDLAGTVSDRLVRHLQVSSVFSQIQTVSGPMDPTSPDHLHNLISLGVDAVLMGDLVHFYGRRDPDRRIEGHVRFENLKLYSVHTGQLLWQGTADKLIQREEKDPGRGDYYAAEALRGANNQLAIQLSRLSFSRRQIYPSELTPVREWRVGVLLPEDIRPSEEKNTEVRRLKGNPNYLLYSDNDQHVNKPFLCGIIKICAASKWQAAPFVGAVTEQWVQKLKAAGIFGNVLGMATRGVTAEELRQWNEEGIDAVLISRLARSSGSVTPPFENRVFPIWSGGLGFQPRFKATALTRIEDVQLIETQTGNALWKGEAECGLERTVHQWETPMIILQESLSITLDRLVNRLSEFSPIPDQKTPVS